MQARALCTAAERNSLWVGRARDKVDFAPKDVQQISLFLNKEREARQVMTEVTCAAPEPIHSKTTPKH